MRSLASLAILGALALALHPARASAQQDDVQWESRTIPHSGGPVRPGAELDGSVNPLAWIGGIAFVGGYAVSIYPATARAEAAIPIVGPWLAISDQLTWNGFSDVDRALCVVAGILQPVGLAVGIFGLLTPHLRLVFTAPVGQPSPNETTYSMTIVPAAPGADAGLSLRVEWL